MSRITSRLVFAAIVVAFGRQSALAGDHATRSYHTSHGSFHHLYMSYRSPWYAPSPTLPYAPEYGFLGHVPANALRGPGYTFVPGVGILGELCDLPTSACTNEYRDGASICKTSCWLCCSASFLMIVVPSIGQSIAITHRRGQSFQFGLRTGAELEQTGVLQCSSPPYRGRSNWNGALEH